jgi:selenocysteine lyase/cysteine desulfurase
VLYLNHAGTSWPRLPTVLAAQREAHDSPPDDWPRRLESARSEVAAFLGIPEPSRLLLTPGCTSALAVALGDLPWTPGDRIVTSGLEHHALARPIRGGLERLGVRLDVAPYAPGVPIDLGFVEARLRAGRVRAVACTAASNVTGERLPVGELVALAHDHGALAVIDAAQTAGLVVPLAAAPGVDVLAFAGHKALLGPQGIGGLYVAPGVELACPAASCDLGPTKGPVRSPFPSYCDVGSVNLAGAAGLAAGVRWLREHGEAARARARSAAERLLAGLLDMSGVTVYGGRNAERTFTVSFTAEQLAPLEIERRLDREHGIAVRAGHHCAPRAHETIGTAERGTLRVSFGHDSAADDADAILSALRALLYE